MSTCTYFILSNVVCLLQYNTYSEQKLSQIKKATDTLKYQKF